MKYGTIFLTLFSFQLIQPTTDKNRTILDIEVPIDEILPPGVVPLVDLSIEPIMMPSLLTALSYGAGALAIGYGAITAHLLYMAYHISKKTTWAYWYSQEAHHLSEQNLFLKIMQMLHKKYKQSDYTHTTILNRFIRELNQELWLLHRFTAWRSKITRLKLNSIFIDQDLVLSKALKSIPDLNSLKKLALSLSRKP
jgi:hypothetical protein